MRDWLGVLILPLVIFSIAGILGGVFCGLGAAGVFDKEPVGGVDSYCYEVRHDPRGDSNEYLYLTEHSPVVDGYAVFLEEAWELRVRGFGMPNKYQYVGDITLLSQGDTKITNRCSIEEAGPREAWGEARQGKEAAGGVE